MPELSVSRKNISTLLREMQNRKFIIPDYQRPYKWDHEKCDVLWADITGFHENITNENEEYFLGTIVSYKENKNVEIIDGQQRLTSFFLLLRAFYTKLEGMTQNPQVTGLKNQVGPCIWDIDPVSQEIQDKKKFHIESLVATEEDKAIFHRILETGQAVDTANDLYSKNYLFLLGKCHEYAMNQPMDWYSLCVTILNKCIILPIECDVQDTALTIFSTLNDRGMPLSDSDIFKAQMYKNRIGEGEKKDFTDQWKELSSICKKAKITLDDVFRFYTHSLRAKKEDKTKEVGLRKFYAHNQYERLKSVELMDNLSAIAKFWLYINSKIKDEGINYQISEQSQKYLHCLTWYPNDFWKYATTVFFLKNKDGENFEFSFADFLRKLTSFLFIKFINKPTVNAIKDDIYSICISVENGSDLNLLIDIDRQDLKAKISAFSSSKLSRSLILLHAYLNSNQIGLIPDNFEIEHIFPKKWQAANYFGWDERDAQTYLEKFGNKVAIEKKLNIQAGNGYFGQKRTKYNLSKIQNVLDIANYKNQDWIKGDIMLREEEFGNCLVDHFETTLNNG